MRWTIGLVVVLIIIAGLGFLLTEKKDTKSNYDRVASQFSIPDKNEVGRIFIAHRTGENIDLKRGRDYWTLNDRYVARQSNVNLLLDMLERIAVKYRPTKAAIPNLINVFATKGIKVEVYDRGGDEMKVFYIGSMSADERATFFIMEDSEEPFAMHIPGFAGNLRARVIANLDSWRERKFMTFDQESITAIKVDFPKQKSNSFEIEKKGSGFSLKASPLANVDDQVYRKGSAEAYLQGLRNIACESYIDDVRVMDSITRMVPFCVVDLQESGGGNHTLRFYPKGEVIQSDFSDPVHRYYIHYEDRDFMIGQSQVIRSAFRAPGFFISD